jgi:photosystem II stability/assembly factor-like uncharacterized protein
MDNIVRRGKAPVTMAAILLVVLCLQTSNAQQWESAKGPEGGTVRALLVDGSDLLAGVWGGVSKFNTVEGVWKPAVSGMVTDWQILCFAQIGQTILAGSEADGIFATTDKGATWRQVNTGLGRLSINALAADDSCFYALANDGTVYWSRNLGDTWAALPMTVSGTGSINAIAVIGSRLLVTSDYPDYSVCALVRTGSTWQAGPKSLVGVSTERFMVQGGAVYAGGDAGVYYSADSGKTWALRNTGLPSAFRWVQCFAAVGPYVLVGLESGKIYRSADAGLSWTETSTNLPPKLWPFCFSVSATDVYVGGQDDGVYRSTDQGLTWTEMNKGLCHRRIFDVRTRGPYVVANSELGRLFVSNDRGATWRKIDPAQHGNMSVRCLASNAKSFFAGTWGAGVYRSDDNGATWTSANQYLTDQYIVSLSVCDTVVYAGSTDNVFQSRDNGARWIAAMSGFPVNCYVREVTKLGRMLFAAAMDTVYRSIDNGANWTKASTGIASNEIWTLASLGKYVYAGTWNGIFRSADSGLTWAASDFGMPYKQVYSIRSVNAKLLAGTESGSVFISSDSGSFWDPLGTSIAPKYNTIAALAVGDSFVYAGTELRSVWRYPFAGAGVARSPLHGHQGQSLFEVSITGGAVPVMTIAYSLPRAGQVKIGIVDLAGRIRLAVRNRYDFAGDHVITSNFRALSPGCYFVSIRSEGMAESRKIVMP